MPDQLALSLTPPGAADPTGAAHEVQCPSCSAAAGQDCRPAEVDGVRRVHFARIFAARRAGAAGGRA